MTTTDYDTAQTAAIWLLQAQLDRAALDIAHALANLGSPDVVTDAIRAARTALAAAEITTADSATDPVAPYAAKAGGQR